MFPGTRVQNEQQQDLDDLFQSRASFGDDNPPGSVKPEGQFMCHNRDVQDMNNKPMTLHEYQVFHEYRDIHIECGDRGIMQSDSPETKSDMNGEGNNDEQKDTAETPDPWIAKTLLKECMDL